MRAPGGVIWMNEANEAKLGIEEVTLLFAPSSYKHQGLSSCMSDHMPGSQPCPSTPGLICYVPKHLLDSLKPF